MLKSVAGRMIPFNPLRLSRRVGLRTMGSIGAKVPYKPEFYDGFETNDFSKWDAATGVVIITSPVHHGTYAARGGAPGVLRHNLPSGTLGPYFCRFFTYVSQLSPTGVTIAILRVVASVGEIVQIGIKRVGSTYYLYFDNAGGLRWRTGTTPITEGWHCIELEISYDLIGNINKLWLDEVLELQSTITEAFTGDMKYITVSPNNTLSLPRNVVDCVIGDIVRPTCAYYPDIKV